MICVEYYMWKKLKRQIMMDTNKGPPLEKAQKRKETK